MPSCLLYSVPIQLKLATRYVEPGLIGTQSLPLPAREETLEMRATGGMRADRTRKAVLGETRTLRRRVVWPTCGTATKRAERIDKQRATTMTTIGATGPVVLMMGQRAAAVSRYMVFYLTPPYIRYTLPAFACPHSPNTFTWSRHNLALPELACTSTPSSFVPTPGVNNKCISVRLANHQTNAHESTKTKTKLAICNASTPDHHQLLAKLTAEARYHLRLLFPPARAHTSRIELRRPISTAAQRSRPQRRRR